jgi:hypothetical protein
MEVPEVNIEMISVQVEPRTIKTKWTVKMGRPRFGMCRSARRHYGIKTDFGYWLWKLKMRIL